MPVPEVLRREHEGWEWHDAWSYEGRVTVYRLDSPSGERRFLKVGGPDRFPTLKDEEARLRWARAHLPVPDVLGYGLDDGIEWLLTSAVLGVDATTDELRAEPERLVPLLSTSLRRFHGAPVDRCPFSYRVDDAIEHAARRVETGRVIPERDFHPAHRHLDAASALARLRELAPGDDDLVVCHGDYCVPNVIVDHWRLSAFVDLGEMSVSDRWRDLAVGAWSVTWNMGPGHEDLFYASYGVEPDPQRIAFFRLLYDMES